MKSPESFNPNINETDKPEKQITRREFLNSMSKFFLNLALGYGFFGMLTKKTGDSTKEKTTKKNEPKPEKKKPEIKEVDPKTELQKLIEKRVAFHVHRIYETNNYDDLVASIDRVNQYNKIINLKSKEKNLNPNLIKGLIFIESKGRPNATNKATDAVGLCQFLSETAKECNLKDRTNPQASIKAAITYIDNNRKETDEDESLGIATFHSGPGNISYLIREYEKINNPKPKQVKYLSFPKIYQTALNNKKSNLYKFLFETLEDESAEYYFKILAASKIINLQNNHPQMIKDIYHIKENPFNIAKK